MNGRKEENLKELFEKFFTAEQAQKAVEDVQKAEQILNEHPAPEPDKELIVNIKSIITASLLANRKIIFRTMVYKVAAVAAAVIIVATISVSLYEKGNGPEKAVYTSIIPRAIWESDDIAADDVDLAVLTAEIEQIEDEVLALQLGESGVDSDTEVTELEMELIETDSYFWKG